MAPTQPSGTAALPAATMIFEGEAGIGDGQIHYRSRASGGQTIHLGPGERRWWTFATGGSAPYALAVRYSNGKEGENELITVTVDGKLTASFQDRDTGDSVEGWNTFVTDEAGTSTLRSGTHTVALEISGGDGCVEIDLVTLRPWQDPGPLLSAQTDLPGLELGVQAIRPRAGPVEGAEQPALDRPERRGVDLAGPD